MPTRVLILTTQPPHEIRAEWPYYQNWTLPQRLEERGAQVTKQSWRDPALTVDSLASFDVVTFLWANNYHIHAIPFTTFLQDVILPAQTRYPRLRVVNDGQLVLWNVDKQAYLQDLAKAGFAVSKTAFIDVSGRPDAIDDVRKQLANWEGDKGPLVLKPSISGSSKGTHLVRNPAQLSESDEAYLESAARDGIDGALMIQAYEAGIEAGEYSMIFIAGKHTHSMLKTPAKGEFRCQAEFGGGIRELKTGEIPASASEVAWKCVRYMEQRFVAPGGPQGLPYMRVDGVLREDASFVIMELEGIEPHLWIETAEDQSCGELMYGCLLGSNKSNGQ